MQEPYLRPVDSVDEDADQTAPDAPAEDSVGSTIDSTDPKERKPARPRASRALPTDRLKLDVQKAALCAIAVASDYGRKTVGGGDIAPRLEIAPSTAALNNGFFVESGLITKEAKGRYKPTPAANEFARTYGFDKRRAGLKLKEPLGATWYYKAVRQQIAGMGPTSRDTLVEVLCHEAEASPQHQPQLATLLAWLEYAGLVVFQAGVYKLPVGDRDADPADETGSDDDANAEVGSVEPEKKTTTDTERATGAQDQEVQPVLAFNFDFALRPDDLAKLSKEQIEAVFEAVGKVMAIKATL